MVGTLRFNFKTKNPARYAPADEKSAVMRETFS